MTAVLEERPPLALPPQQAPWNQKVYQAILHTGLAILGFFLVYSTAGVAIGMGVIAIACVFAPRLVWQQRAWREPLNAWSLALLAYIALRTFLFDGLSRASVGAVNHYQELLVLPVMWSVFRTARRPQVFTVSLLLGAVLCSVVVWTVMLRWWGMVPGWGHVQDHLDNSVNIRRIELGFCLAVCAYLAAEHARLRALPPMLGYGIALFMAATVLFALIGRTGYLILLVLIGCMAWRASPPKWRVWAAVAMVCLGVLLAAMSGAVRSRMAETVDGLEHKEHAVATSTQIRLELVANGLAVAKAHWLAGVGWVHYNEEFHRQAVLRHPQTPDILGAYTVNPHDEYLMQLGGGGLLALLLFLGWIGWPMWRAWRDRDQPWAGTLGCVALAFAVGSVFNSLLFDFTEAHFYVALMPWLLVRRLDRH